jgi:hypothetical protein
VHITVGPRPALHTIRQSQARLARLSTKLRLVFTAFYLSARCTITQLLVPLVGVNVLPFGIVGIRASVNDANMAEAAAIIGLVSPIASLVDLSAKVVSRLQ